VTPGSPNAEQGQPPITPESSEINAFTQRCYAQYSDKGASRRFTEAYLTRVCRITQRFLEWTDRTVISATEADFERWSAHLARELKLKPATQRAYQNHVRSFFGFVCKRTQLQNDCQRLFGCRVQLVAHEDNCMVHLTEDDSDHAHPPMTTEEVDRFFFSFDERIEYAEVYG
jgi:hypothetical protein